MFKARETITNKPSVDDDIKRQISYNFKSLRIAAKVPRQKAAFICGVTENEVVRWEDKYQSIPADCVRRLCDHIHVPTAVIIEGKIGCPTPTLLGVLHLVPCAGGLDLKQKNAAQLLTEALAPGGDGNGVVFTSTK